MIGRSKLKNKIKSIEPFRNGKGTTVVIQTKPFLIHVTFIVGFLGPSLRMFCFVLFS